MKKKFWKNSIITYQKTLKKTKKKLKICKKKIKTEKILSKFWKTSKKILKR